MMRWYAVMRQSATDPRTALVRHEFNTNRAWRDLHYQVRLGYRVPGTQAHRRTRDWLTGTLSSLSGHVTLQRFTRHLGGREVEMWNIVATFPGAGDEPREEVLLAAHWDTRPTADEDPITAHRRLPVPGANDGASGVAVLLEIARQLHAQPVSRDVTMVLFDGEDYGPGLEHMLLGSKHYAATLGDDKPDWGILLDMVGDRNLTIYREPFSEQFAPEVNDRIFRAAGALGYANTRFINKQGARRVTDDHIPLNKVGVPMANLIDYDYSAWHTRRDVPAQCSPTSLDIVGRTVLRAIQL